MRSAGPGSQRPRVIGIGLTSLGKVVVSRFTVLEIGLGGGVWFEVWLLGVLFCV